MAKKYSVPSAVSEELQNVISAVEAAGGRVKNPRIIVAETAEKCSYVLSVVGPRQEESESEDDEEAAD